jgi:hypothetical protein
VAAAIPVFGGDEAAAQFQFIHYDGRTKFPTILDQNDYLLETGYYVHRVKVQPFFKYESQTFVTAAALPRMSTARASAGTTIFVART